MLSEKMKSFNGEWYVNKWIKQKLIEQYGDSIIFYNNSTQKTIVAFQYKTKELLDKFYHEGRKTVYEDEKKRLLNVAAQLILHDIHLSECTTGDIYPSHNQLKIDTLLNLLLEISIHRLENFAEENNCFPKHKFVKGSEKEEL